jgi:hypothetical protein
MMAPDTVISRTRGRADYPMRLRAFDFGDTSIDPGDLPPPTGTSP